MRVTGELSFFEIGVPESERARKEHLIAEFRIARSEEVTGLIEDSGVDSLAYGKRWGRYRLRLTDTDLKAQDALLRDLVSRAKGMSAAPGKD